MRDYLSFAWNCFKDAKIARNIGCRLSTKAIPDTPAKCNRTHRCLSSEVCMSLDSEVMHLTEFSSIIGITHEYFAANLKKSLRRWQMLKPFLYTQLRRLLLLKHSAALQYRFFQIPTWHQICLRCSTIGIPFILNLQVIIKTLEELWEFFHQMLM